MRNADTLQTINCEQLATATDRLLHRSGRVSKHRPSTRAFSPQAHGSWMQLTRPVPAWGTQSEIPARAVRGSQRKITRLIAAPRRNAVQPQMFAVAVMIPTIVGFALGIEALL